jgi:hypothetical protein
VVGVDGSRHSSTIVVGVDGARRAADELDVELCPAKELEYVFELCSCTSRSALQACLNKVVIYAYSLQSSIS